ncbi:unnamed protein product [Coccothraustes coccothraustes]
MIPAGKAGLVIGKGGETIKQLQERAGVKMILIQDGSQNTNVDKPLRIIGEPYKVQQACEMVLDILRERDQGGFGERSDYGARLGGGIDVPVPRHSVGVVIGRSGEMIKKIQNDAGVRIQFKQDDGTGPEKIAHIMGPPERCEHAARIINELLQSLRVIWGGGFGSGPPGPPGPGLPPGGRGRGRGQGTWGPPGGEMTFSIPTHKCGLVIGRGGENVKAINQQTGAFVEISRQLPPTGTPISNSSSSAAPPSRSTTPSSSSRRKSRVLCAPSAPAPVPGVPPAPPAPWDPSTPDPSTRAPPEPPHSEYPPKKSPPKKIPNVTGPLPKFFFFFFSSPGDHPHTSIPPRVGGTRTPSGSRQPPTTPARRRPRTPTRLGPPTTATTTSSRRDPCPASRPPPPPPCRESPPSRPPPARPTTPRPGRSTTRNWLTEEAVRRYLSRKPMTTKDLLKKFQTKRTGLSSDATVNALAQLLKRLDPERKLIADKMHFFLKE